MRNPIRARFGRDGEEIDVMGPAWPEDLGYWDVRFSQGGEGIVPAHDIYSQEGARWKRPPRRRGRPAWTNPVGDLIPEPGDRIELLHMPDDPRPIPVGTKGTVTSVSMIGMGGGMLGGHQGGFFQVSVDWDNGRRLMLSIPPDRVRILGPRPNPPDPFSGAHAAFRKFRGKKHGDYVENCLPCSGLGLAAAGLAGAAFCNNNPPQDEEEQRIWEEMIEDGATERMAERELVAHRKKKAKKAPAKKKAKKKVAKKAKKKVVKKAKKVKPKFMKEEAFTNFKKKVDSVLWEAEDFFRGKAGAIYTIDSQMLRDREDASLAREITRRAYGPEAAEEFEEAYWEPPPGTVYIHWDIPFYKPLGSVREDFLGLNQAREVLADPPGDTSEARQAAYEAAKDEFGRHAQNVLQALRNLRGRTSTMALRGEERAADLGKAAGDLEGRLSKASWTRAPEEPKRPVRLPEGW